MGLAVHFKATYQQSRIYVWGVILMILLGRLADLIVTLSLGNDYSTRLSDGNLLILILIFMSILLPLVYYKRIIHLGASREHYYMGLQFVYAAWAAVIALINSLWFVLEVKVLRQYTATIDLVEAFQWDQFGLVGSFLYQLAFYMMAMALISLLVSGYSSPVGWLLWALVIAAIPVGTAIPSLRAHVVDFFETLLFNDSLVIGVGFNLLLYAAFLAGGWLFTRRRTH